MTISEVLALVLLYGDCANEETRAKALKLVPGLKDLVSLRARAYRFTATVDGQAIDQQDVVCREEDLEIRKISFQQRFALETKVLISVEMLK